MKALQTPMPCIETLLTAAHRDLEALRSRCAALEIRGIGRDHLPDDTALMAFALLGDHERDGLLARVHGQWANLQSRGLVYGAIEAVATAELRLLEHVRDQTEALGPAWQQLRETMEAPEPPREIWQSATRVRGSWGQIARLHFSMQGISHLSIEPDPVFGLQPALLAADPDVAYTGAFPFPIDNGAITISLLHRGGEVYRHVVESLVAEAA